MRVVVVGLGVQGSKRRSICGDEFLASVDPANKQADYLDLTEISLDSYDAALVCTPDQEKFSVLKYCLDHKKHVLVEKPLWADEVEKLSELENIARTNRVVCYTAYNHRFEPHFVQMRNLIHSGQLGQIYSCRLFYGNGTARLVRDSSWRDVGAGVLPDLGSHLIDTCKYWFGKDINDNWELVSANCFENSAPDHVVIALTKNNFRIECEMTLLMWRNTFTCDILAENGTSHIESLCKWGPSKFTHRKRLLPSGVPKEAQAVLNQSDPTWSLEYDYFKQLMREKVPTDLSWDKKILDIMEQLERAIS